MAQRVTAMVALTAAILLIVALPGASVGASPVQEAVSSLDETVKKVTASVDRTVQEVAAPVQQAVQQAAAPVQQAAAPVQQAAGQAQQSGAQAQTRQQEEQPALNPPLHGTNPHGQGTVAVTDINPSSERPFSGDTTGEESGEEVVVGRSRGEQQADGSYHGRITIAALFGNEILGVETDEGESRTGPLEPVQQAVLDPLCTGSGDQICLEVLAADSTTTENGSTNRFAVASARLGGAEGISVGAAESRGAIADDGTCQQSEGSSRVANVSAGGGAVADVAESSSTTRACRGQDAQVTNASQVIGLGGTGVPIPAAGCADGTPDTVTGIPTLAPIVCNADSVMANSGVRHALDVFVLQTGGTSLVQLTTAASESLAVAPAGPTDGGGETECSDGIDNDGDNRIDLADPDCTGPDDNSESPDGTGGAGETECADNRDNDGDGRIDLADPDCESRSDDSESPTGGAGDPECSDGVDNDGDGRTDFPADPDCASRQDDSEGPGTRGAGAPECSDGVDNDGDGRTDFPADPDCTSRQDDSEGPGGAPECSDGIDNDGDGRTDFPNDPDCTSRSDDSEGPSALRSGLPFTGADTVGLALAGLLLVAGGMLLRRRTLTG